MGLLRAAAAATSSALADQWKEYFYCDTLPDHVFVVKGQKRVGTKSSNTNGSDNIITNGSGIAVNDGQCMIIVDQGRVVDICAEPGLYTYDMSSEPSIFSGSLGKGILETFKTIGKRFAQGGDTGKDQRVYYFNLKEMMDNKFGTANPIPFRVSYPELGKSITVTLRCNGQYSYRIADPLLFYTNVCGNVTQAYTRSQIETQLKAEFMNALAPAFGKVSAMGVRYDELSIHTAEIAEAMNETLTKLWKEKRGLEIVSVAINPVTISDKDLAKITELEDVAWLRNPLNAAAYNTQRSADIAEKAAGNSAGAMMGFMGMNIAQMNNGAASTQDLYQMGMQQQAAQQAAAAQNANTWTCACGTTNTGKFCLECGKPNPANAAGWTCECGTLNKGKFCAECGRPKPAGAPLYKCDKCGWEPADPTKPPKFCPECGDIFDENDIQ